MQRRTAIVLTAGILGFFLAQSHLSARQPVRRSLRSETRRAAPANRIGLTEAQTARLEELRKDWEKESQARREEPSSLSGQLRALGKDLTTDAAKIEALRDRIFALRLDRIKRTYDHRKEIRNVFTPEQREQLARIERRTRRHRSLWNRSRTSVPRRGRGFDRFSAGRG